MIDIQPATTVKELLATHPEAFGVFESHGMCSDCRSDPPPVPLSHFATKHCEGDITGLMAELRQAIGSNGG